MHPQRWTKVVRKPTVNVQCAERALGGAAELSTEILREQGGERISSVNARNLTENH